MKYVCSITAEERAALDCYVIEIESAVETLTSIIKDDKDEETIKRRVQRMTAVINEATRKMEDILNSNE